MQESGFSFRNKEFLIALLAVLGIAFHLVLRFSALHTGISQEIPLAAVLLLGGVPLVFELLKKLIHLQFGSDLLAGISIIASVCLGEYLAGSIVVLMLSGGEALEEYAVKKASSVLGKLANRMPNVTQKKTDKGFEEISLDQVLVGDLLVVLPHQTCPVDGEVIEGRSVMDESYLTGEPFQISKTPGSLVISGAVNGEGALTIRATRLPKDSRYARIMEVMTKAEQERPVMRRLADALGAWYTPIALVVSILAWMLSGEATRFLAVLVIATPCPLLIAIPISIIGAISLSARRGIIIRDPAVLEQINICEVMILDKTGTLTYGAPTVTSVECLTSNNHDLIIQLAASLERYSKHPLAVSVIKEKEARKLSPLEVSEVSEKPGQGLRGIVDGHEVRITSRKQLKELAPNLATFLPETQSGMECCVIVDQKEFGIIRFHDDPRKDSKPFVDHLRPKHKFRKVMIVSGDRESEVRYLAEKVGITEVYWGQTPEQKVERVKAESLHARTLFIGDGINDAPALTSATVGVAFGQHSDVTAESAGAVIMDSSLKKVDELFHISHHMRSIALQSAVGGMALSIIGMLIAAGGHLTPVAGAIGQEVIDLFAVLNALRVAWPPRELSDY